MTGAFTTNTTGTDLYTLSESGTLTGSGTFAETVTGTDAYSGTTDVGNTAQQTDTSTTTGGGAWTRTASGAATGGSGTNAYTLTETGDALVGNFSQSETGTDRYGLVEAFDNVANDASGNTPGNVSFHSVGLPFRDPPPVPEVAPAPRPVKLEVGDKKAKSEYYYDDQDLFALALLASETIKMGCSNAQIAILKYCCEKICNQLR